MKKVTVEGIVLNDTNYGETSKILNILTKEYGLISVMAKGARTIKNRLRGISMKLVYANFTINYKETGISILQEGSVINSFKTIFTNFEQMNYAMYLLQLVKNILKETNDSNMFFLLKEALIKINEKFSPKLISNIVEIKLLSYLGVKPDFSKCIICDNSEVLTFDMNLAGCVCKNCYQNTYLFSKTTLKLLNLFQTVEINKIDKLNITSKKTLEELELFIHEYYETYTGIYILNKERIKL